MISDDTRRKRKTRKRKVFERRTTGSATNQHRMRFTLLFGEFEKAPKILSLRKVNCRKPSKSVKISKDGKMSRK